VSVKRRVFSIIFWIVCVIVLLFLFAWVSFEFYGKKYIDYELKKRLGPNATWQLKSFNPFYMSLTFKFSFPQRSGSFFINKDKLPGNMGFSVVNYKLSLPSVNADVSLLKTLLARHLLFSSLKVDGGDLSVRLTSPSEVNKVMAVGSDDWMHKMLPFGNIKVTKVSSETFANKINRYSDLFLRGFVSQILPQGTIDISNVRISLDRKLRHRTLGDLNLNAHRVNGKFYLKLSLDEPKSNGAKLLLAKLFVKNAYRSKPDMRLYLALNPSLLQLRVAGVVNFWFDFKRSQLSDFKLRANLIPLSKRVARDLRRLSFDMYWIKQAKESWRLILSPVDVFLAKENKHIVGHLYAQRKQVGGVDSFDVFIPKFSMNILSIVKPILNLGDNFLSNKKGVVKSNLLDKLLKSVRHIHAQGGVSNLKWHYQYPSLSRLSPRGYNIGMSLENISFDPFSPIPGVKALHGKLQLDNNGGAVLFDANSIKLYKQKLFPLGWPKTDVRGKLFWKVKASRLSVVIPGINFDSTLPGFKSNKGVIEKREVITNLSGNFYVPKDANGNYNIRKTKVALIANSRGENVAPIVPYFLPHNLPSGALDWLTQGIVKVPKTTARMIWSGVVGDYPYLDNRGAFDVRVELVNSQLKPWHDWPLVTGLNGSLDFFHDQFKAVVTDAKSMGVQTKDLTITIPHMHGHKLHWIEGVATLGGEGEDVISFINNTPLKHNFSQTFDILSVKGPLKVDLNLTAPLSKKHSDLMRYFGKVDFKNNTLNLFKANLPFENVNGEIKYNNHLLEAPSIIKANLFNFPANIQFKPTYNKSETKMQNHLHIQTLLDVDKWAATFPSLNLDKSDVHGLLPVIFNASFDKDFVDAKLVSDLKGLELKLPAPFYHSVLTDKNLYASYLDVAGKVKFDFKVDNLLNSRFKWQSSAFKSSLSGLVNFGESLKDEDTITPGLISVKGSLPYFSETKWVAWLSKHTNHGVAGEVNSSQWHYFDISELDTLTRPDISVDIFIKQFNFIDQIWKGVSLKAFANQWFLLLRLNNKHETINGNIYIPMRPDMIGYKVIDARFNNLRVTIPSGFLSKSSPKKSTKSKSPTKDNTKKTINQRADTLQKTEIETHYRTVFDQAPNLNVDVENFKLQDNDLGLLKFRLRHLGSDLMIPHLKIKNKLFTLTGSASSQWKKSGQISHITGKLDSQNWGELFHQLYLPRGLSKGKGSTDFNLTWKGFLTEPKVETLDGDASFDVKDGSLDKVNVGLGRLLGLMSLDTIVRRLSLNFSDLTDKGLAFDSFSGDFNLKNGVATTNNVKMEAPSLSFDLKGDVDLVNKTINQTIIVVPHVGGGLALAAGLLGGPIVGLSTLLGEQILSHTVLKGKGAKYHYVGPWDNPKLEEV
jgi:uncharacterized protein (TIGR02099 family)